jgi:penicillin G amidase
VDWKQNLLFPVVTPVLKAGLWLASRSRLPQINGKIHSAGLDKPVEVLRDKWGIPHIYAQNQKDLFFAQGFVHAQERLWQMDFTRRVVFGRLAEVLGTAALPVDRSFRTVSLFKTAEIEAEKVPTGFCDLVNAYCSGVNEWMGRAIDRHKLPVEFMLLGYEPEPWAVKDSLGWGKMLSWTLAVNWQSELYRRLLLERLGPEKTAELEIDIDKAWAVVLDLGMELAGNKTADSAHLYAGPRAGEGVGSNNWVLHGSRTVSGKPLLANDMHLELTTPGIWFENHLVGGGMDVTGVSLPGVPMVISGHNRQMAWGYTDSCPDMQDLYEEHMRRTPEGNWEYEFKGQWVAAEMRKEVIKIKGGGAATQEVVTTRHGPLVNVLFNDAFPEVPPMALKWTALEADNDFQAIHRMNLAKDCTEFHEALRDFANPSQNVVYADINGDIGYTMNGRIPIRAKGDGTVPAPGWTGEYEWLGYIPLEELPHLKNPPRGFVATANNQIERPDFPHFLGRDYLVSERSGRIVEMIEARQKIDIPYIQAMQYDRIAISARLMAKALGALDTDEPTLQKIIEKMHDWNGELDKDSPLASIFEASIREAGGLMINHHFGELGRRARGDGPFAGQWPDHLWEFFVRLLDQPESAWFNLGNGEKRDDVLKLALIKAVDYLKKEFGPDMEKWTWGRLHKVTFAHILGRQKPLDKVFNIGPFPIGGDGNTIAASFTSFCDLDACPVVGPPFRFIADLGDIEHCLGMLAPGQSGHLASKHFKDGLKGWFEGEYHPMLFSRERIELNLEGRLKLVPR